MFSRIDPFIQGVIVGMLGTYIVVGVLLWSYGMRVTKIQPPEITNNTFTPQPLKVTNMSVDGKPCVEQESKTVTRKDEKGNAWTSVETTVKCGSANLEVTTK